MSLLDRGRVQIRLGDYGTAPASALADGSVHAKAQEYRRLAGSRMIPLDRRDLRSRLPAAEYHVSRKIDGEFTVLVFQQGEVATVNPGGTVRVGLPWLEEARERLGKAGVKQALVAGELYAVRADGKRPRVHDVIHVAGTPSSTADLESLRFAAFDLIEIDGKPAGPSYAETFKRLGRLFEGGTKIHPVETVLAKSIEDVEKRFADWVETEGGEGVVARSDTAGTFKIKPRQSIDAAVVGFTEGIDDRKGMLHDMLVALMREDGAFHLFARVGGGYTDEQRRSLLSDLKDMAAGSDYAEVNPEHVAYQMVRPEWVVEVSCLDLVSQTTRGGTIDRMVLQWDAKVPKYAPLRRMPLASALSPNFVRRREDKTIRPSDLRLKQLTDLVEVPHADRKASDLALPKSQLLRREAYTKTMKGQTLVRKLLLWKTNKETEGDSHPGFVLHYTDFSPNRKTPLEREIRVSNSKEQLDAIWTAFESEYIVKGWAKAGS